MGITYVYKCLESRIFYRREIGCNGDEDILKEISVLRIFFSKMRYRGQKERCRESNPVQGSSFIGGSIVY